MEPPEKIVRARPLHVVLSIALGAGIGLVLLGPLPGLGQADPPPVPPARMDGDLVSAIHAVNDAGIESGDAAAIAAKNEDVKAFARKMAADHAASNQKIDRWLAADGGVSASEGPITRTMRAGAARDKELLAGQSGSQYERIYVNQQVQANQALLTIIDGEGKSTSQSMTGLLEDARNMLNDHLTQARALQARISSSK